MIIITGHLTVDPVRRDRALALSADAVAQARRAEGCLHFAVSADPIDPARINVAERWTDRVLLQRFRGQGTEGDLADLIISADVSENEVNENEVSENEAGPPGYPPVIHSGDHGQISAWARTADAAADLVYENSGNRVTYLARGSETGGTYGLYHWQFGGPPSGPEPHFHRTLTESFYVLSGTVTIFDGRRWRDCGAGDFVHVPAGGVHGFRNNDGPARMLLHFAPGGRREPYFEGLADGLGDLSPSEIDAFMAAHDNIWVPAGDLND